MSTSGKKVQAVASDFFVVFSCSWIQAYDEKCKKLVKEVEAKFHLKLLCATKSDGHF